MGHLGATNNMSNTMDKIQLPYTLQTWVGMVQNNGLPQAQWTRKDTLSSLPALDKHKTVTLPRQEASASSAVHQPLRERMRNLTTREQWRISTFQDYVETDWSAAKHAAISETAIACLRAKRLPNEKHLEGAERDKQRYIANILACQSGKTDIHRLMTLMKNRTRLNLEQAAALIVSAFVKHGRLADAEVLVRELTGVLAVSCMSEGWESSVSHNTLAKGAAESFAHAGEKTRLWCSSKAVEVRGCLPVDDPRNYHDFVQLLLRVRSVRPTTKTRCLYIPRWMFDRAGIEPTGGHAVYLNEYQAELEKQGRLTDVLKGYKWPENPAGEDSIILSKHAFRILQRIVFRLYRFWDPVVRLRHGVRELEDKVLYASSWIDKQLRETDDVAKVACWFFGYQRRLQLKVVSDDQWTRFLAKGEGALLYQNSMRMKSTFEMALARIAGLELDSLAIAGGGGEKDDDDDTLRLIDETCLLMKEYVEVYGAGKKQNLVFQKGVSGGKGRGAVDEYNMLCVILRDLKTRAKDEGIEDLPGPVYKFLAKDIMSWNKSWDDDAFANGKVHGWEEWVVKRGLVGGAGKHCG